MKSFLNVLYRRILYKIPLKLLLILLAVFGLLFACTKAEFTCNVRNYVSQLSISQQGSVNPDFSNGQDIRCIVPMGSSNATIDVSIDNINRTTLTRRDMFCMYESDGDTLYFRGNTTQVYQIYTLSSCLDKPYTSLQCQTKYSLIPINEVDSSYCQSNNLCPSSGSPTDCPNVGVSNVFINDLFHPGAFNIVMNIPDEIDWDYAYTNSGNNMNIDIVGYNVDYEKMQDIIDTQNYKPNSDELSSIISQIIPLFVPGLCIILLLYFIFRFIKKIF